MYSIISSIVSVQYCPLSSKEPTSEGEGFTMSDPLPMHTATLSSPADSSVNGAVIGGIVAAVALTVLVLALIVLFVVLLVKKIPGKVNGQINSHTEGE